MWLFAEPPFAKLQFQVHLVNSLLFEPCPDIMLLGSSNFCSTVLLVGCIGVLRSFDTFYVISAKVS